LSPEIPRLSAIKAGRDRFPVANTGFDKTADSSHIGRQAARPVRAAGG